jgi:hypothetical protein
MASLEKMTEISEAFTRAHRDAISPGGGFEIHKNSSLFLARYAI